MPIFAVDTNCMIAAICSWHEHHAAAFAEVNRRLARGERLSVPAPGLVEAYAVLTRLPAPHRLAPRDAWTLIGTNFARRDSLQTLTAAAYRRLLRGMAAREIAGGRVYDAVIGECARQARAEVLLTFNRRHFDPPPTGVSVVEPSASE